MNVDGGTAAEPAQQIARLQDQSQQWKYEVPDVYYFDFDKKGLEKPWLENKEKMDEIDYSEGSGETQKNITYKSLNILFFNPF